MITSLLSKGLVALFLATALFAQQPDFPIPGIEFNPNIYFCVTANEPIIVDGKDDEASWGLPEWSEEFVDIEGPSKPKPKQSTRFKMLWDEANLYIFAKLEEKDIWAKLLQRDTVIFYDNDFEIFIDPDGDTHNYYELELNAFNTVWDLFLLKPYRDGRKVALNGWDINGLESKVNIEGTVNDPADEDTAWTVEIAIPWRSLTELSENQGPPRAGDYWRMNFSRVHWETEVINGNYKKKSDRFTGKVLPEYNWVWSPQGIIAMHYPEMWGFVVFTDREEYGTRKFNIPPVEYQKWELRKLYYAQKNFFKLHGRFTAEVDELEIESPSLTNEAYLTKINALEGIYYAESISKDSTHKIVLYQDGLIEVINRHD